MVDQSHAADTHGRSEKADGRRLYYRTTQNQNKSSFLLWVDCSAQVGQLLVFYSETVAGNLSDEQQISLLFISSGKKLENETSGPSAAPVKRA